MDENNEQKKENERTVERVTTHAHGLRKGDDGKNLCVVVKWVFMWRNEWSNVQKGGGRRDWLRREQPFDSLRPSCFMNARTLHAKNFRVKSVIRQ